MQHPVHTILSVSCLTVAILLSGCSNNGDDSTDDALPADDAPTDRLDEAALEQLEGIWERRGYGDLYAYADNRTTWYTLTENTCLEIVSFAGLQDCRMWLTK